MAAGVANSKHLYGEAFNLVPDDSISVLELVRKIVDEAGANVQPVVQSANASFEMEHLDNSKARKMLDWAPKFDLTAGLRETIDWYRNRGSSQVR